MATTMDLMKALQRVSRQQDISLDDVRTGSVVVINSGFGNEPAETVTLTGVEDDVKNGFPGCVYTDSAGEGRWAYLSQIVRVVKY